MNSCQGRLRKLLREGIGSGHECTLEGLEVTRNDELLVEP